LVEKEKDIGDLRMQQHSVNKSDENRIAPDLPAQKIKKAARRRPKK
jgi:hypothetical protein